MLPFEQLVKPTWGVERWLKSAWDALTKDEQLSIKKRMDEMFYQELPFQLEHDKILYLHLFSMLTQLEIFGLRGLLSSAKKLANSSLHGKLWQQIQDEIFHAMVFARITYQLAAPYSLPPTQHKNIDKLMAILADEPDLKTSLVLINLVAEGWIEEVFIAMQKYNVAPRVFEVACADESRHLEESELYLVAGLPDKLYLTKQLASLEEELIATLFSQTQSAISLANILGIEATNELISNIDNKHHSVLARINHTPSPKWKSSIETIRTHVDRVFHDVAADAPVELTMTRKIFSSLWSAPSLPTQSSVFSINVTPVCFFEKKFPAETINCLLLQAISQISTENPFLKNYLCHQKIYNPNYMSVGLAVRLPNCADHLGMIEFTDCHNMNIVALAQHVQNDLKIMQYCYNKTEELKAEHPYLMDVFNELLQPRSYDNYATAFLPRPTISLSNIGYWGYEIPVSPLFPNETVKFTLGKIERKQVWNNKSKAFEIQDSLPVGISVDHRVFDGNVPIPHFIQAAFNQLFTAIPKTPVELAAISVNLTDINKVIAASEKLLEKDLEIGFRTLFIASHVWKNQINPFSIDANKLLDEAIQ